MAGCLSWLATSERYANDIVYKMYSLLTSTWKRTRRGGKGHPSSFKCVWIWYLARISCTNSVHSAHYYVYIAFRLWATTIATMDGNTHDFPYNTYYSYDTFRWISFRTFWHLLGIDETWRFYGTNYQYRSFVVRHSSLQINKRWRAE